VRNRLLVVGAGLAAAVLLFVLLRPEDEDGAAPAATTTAATTSATATQATTEEAPTTTAPPPQPEPTTISVTVRGGRPVGGIKRVTVEQGEVVRVVVRSDVVDHVHVHGYDVLRDVGPGRPALMAFRATVAGGFEIELEERGLQIAQVEVRP